MYPYTCTIFKNVCIYISIYYNEIDTHIYLLSTYDNTAHLFKKPKKEYTISFTQNTQANSQQVGFFRSPVPSVCWLPQCHKRFSQRSDQLNGPRKKTWGFFHSSMSTYLDVGVRWDLVQFKFWWIFTSFFRWLCSWYQTPLLPFLYQ